MRDQAGETNLVKTLVLPMLLGACGLALAAEAPVFRALDEKNYAQVVAAYKGQVVLVDFWATWCTPCREEMPQLVKLSRDYRAKGFRLVTVSCDEPEDHTKAALFLASAGAPEPAYLKQAKEDEAFINSVEKTWSGALPALFLYDRSGRLVRSFIGETEISAIEQALRKLL